MTATPFNAHHFMLITQPHALYFALHCFCVFPKTSFTHKTRLTWRLLTDVCFHRELLVFFTGHWMAL